MILLLEKQLTNFELSKELEGLGCPQESLWCWYTHLESDCTFVARFDAPNSDGMVVQACSAFTTSELGKILPKRIDLEREIECGENKGQLTKCVASLCCEWKPAGWVVSYLGFGKNIPIY